MAELADQLGKMVEHPKSKSAQPRFAKRRVSLFRVDVKSAATFCCQEFDRCTPPYYETTI